jgi:hypothetical protein
MKNCTYSTTLSLTLNIAKLVDTVLSQFSIPYLSLRTYPVSTNEATYDAHCNYTDRNASDMSAVLMAVVDRRERVDSASVLHSVDPRFITRPGNRIS